ncbi:unnamed protein product [Adineta ricciae]|uniref:Uncharacterized protein n=1 Tax=Adineta ricciae TaxID=249248 RepID=A0A814C1C1_ADIRI|nr:unnamed protein product [Adineta ricciae]
MQKRRLIILTLILVTVYLIFHHTDLNFLKINYHRISPYNKTIPSFTTKCLILSNPIQLEQYLTAPQPNVSVILTGNHPHINPPPNNLTIIFLNSKLLSTLSFRTTNINTIAYLLAIKHGARLIYQLHPHTPLSHLRLHHYQSQDIHHVAFHRQRSPFVNILPTFTADFNSSLSGLPQQELINITQDGWTSIRKLLPYGETIRPLIQQYIPTPLAHDSNDSSFVDHPPVAVEPMTFSPFTTTNVLFAYDAFWALPLPESYSHIWRSWWVQRLLWDVGGHLVFHSSSVNRTNSVLPVNYGKTVEEDERVSKLVRYLSEWTSSKATLVERMRDLMTDMVKHKFCEVSEMRIIENWVEDLATVKYVYPSIETVTPSKNSQQPRRRRTAVCLTGLIECVEEAWRKTSNAIRSHLTGEIDVFMYLSSTEPTIALLATVPLRTRMIEALRYSNFTVKVLFENIPKLDPQFPPSCTTDASVDQPEFKVPRYYQQLFGLSNCFSLVRDYEKKYNVKYDLMVRTRGDIEFLKIPSTFERSSPFDVNDTLILPPNRFSSKVDDGFAIGPIDSVEVYMNRYYSFRECITRDLHPERYLYFYLNHRKVKMTIDHGTVVAHIPHSPKHCH